MLGVPSNRFAPTPSMSPGLNRFGNQPSELPSNGVGNWFTATGTGSMPIVGRDAADRTASLNPAPWLIARLAASQGCPDTGRPYERR